CTPNPITDKSETVIGCMVPPPTEEWAGKMNEEATSALEREKANQQKKKRSGITFKEKEEAHRRGNYLLKADGLSCGGGQTVLKRIYHSKRNRAALNRLRNEKAFIRIAGHMSAAFAHWSPRLFDYYREVTKQLKAHDPSLFFNFSNSVFCCATYNFGPQTVALEHLDHLNYIAGWCGITALGHFDSKKGGHIVLWDLKLVLEFPPGWTILIPSSYIRHSNTCISPGETRYSFTQYTAGSIFRYVQDGFQMRTQMTKEDRKEAEKKQRERINVDLNMYSTISELKALYVVQ
ncbi:hypothetical protein K435DRAFT_655477, partial [Dendrothele bispora CBS 962.96]